MILISVNRDIFEIEALRQPSQTQPREKQVYLDRP